MPTRPKYPRLSIELVTADEQELPWRIRAAAARRRLSLREYVLAAITHALAADEQQRYSDE